VPWLPNLEFASPIFPAGGAQFRDDFGVLRRKPVLQLVERFHRGEHGRRDFNGVRSHWHTLTLFFVPLKQGFWATSSSTFKSTVIFIGVYQQRASDKPREHPHLPGLSLRT
jgi:hypothetical protein